MHSTRPLITHDPPVEDKHMRSFTAGQFVCVMLSLTSFATVSVTPDSVPMTATAFEDLSSCASWVGS